MTENRKSTDAYRVALTAHLAKATYAPVTVTELLTSLWYLGMGREYAPAREHLGVVPGFRVLTSKRLFACITNFCTQVPENYAKTLWGSSGTIVVRIGYNDSIFLKLLWGDKAIKLEVMVSNDVKADDLYERLEVWKQVMTDNMLLFPGTDKAEIHPNI